MEILQNFSTINQSIMFLQGHRQRIITNLNVVYAEATVKEEFPRDCGVYNLPMFLGILSLFKDPDLSFDDSKVTIEEGSHKATYRYCNPSLFVWPPKDKNLNVQETIFSFEFTAENLKTIMKAVSLYSHEELSIEADGEAIFVKTVSMKEGSSAKAGLQDGMSYRIGESNQKFRYVVKVENLKILMHSYDVAISKNKLLTFKSKNMDLTYIIPSEANHSGDL